MDDASIGSSRTATRFYAVERDGELRRATLAGDLFGGLLGRRRRARRPRRASRVLAPVRPSKIVCVGLNYKDHAAEVEQGAAGRAAAVPQAADGGASIPARRSGCRPASAASITKRSWRSSSAAARIACRAARRLGLHLRPHLRERRHGARYAEQGVAVHALQGVRHVRADRAVHRRPGSNGEPRAVEGWVNGERRQVVEHRAADLPDRAPRGVHHVRDDARAWRHHLDRHAGRVGPLRRAMR